MLFLGCSRQRTRVRCADKRQGKSFFRTDWQSFWRGGVWATGFNDAGSIAPEHKAISDSTMALFAEHRHVINELLAPAPVVPMMDFETHFSVTGKVITFLSAAAAALVTISIESLLPDNAPMTIIRMRALRPESAIGAIGDLL